MALTKPFKTTIHARAITDKAFRIALLEEALNELLSGDFATAKMLLRQYVNAAISFEDLAHETKLSNKSIQRMLGPSGNPTSENLLSILHAIQRCEGVTIHTKIQR